MAHWRRLEGINLDPELTEGLSARLADPLWTLCRQWQVGEFHGEDAASPVLVRAEVDTMPIVGVQVGQSMRLTDHLVPLESYVEREAVRSGPAAHRLALEAGAALLRRLRRGGFTTAANALLRGYPVDLRRLGDLDEDLDPVGAARLRLLAERTLDVGDLAIAISRAGGDAAALPEIASLDKPALAADEIARWQSTEALLFAETQPGERDGWINDRLEYRFAVLAERDAQKVMLNAPEYAGGDLDWYHVDVDKVDGKFVSPSGPTEPGKEPPGRSVVEVLASPLRYAGQPASRFWEFEDGDVDFGDLAGGPEDIARSVIASYAAVGGDDWLLVPVTLPVGCVARTAGVWVLDNFEQRPHQIRSTAVEDIHAASQGLRPNDRPWRFFELAGDPGPAEGGGSPLLFLPPVVDTIETSRPLEAVEFRRDEMSNLAWGIERRVESAWGRAVDRDATIVRRDPPVQGVWDFTLLTSVPPSWVPLVPVQRPAGEWPQMVLQRGVMAVENKADATDSRSVVLSARTPFILQEEEVPAGGVRVSRRWQMARDHEGGIVVWVGRLKRPASGPMRRSPLVFDELRTAGD